MGEPLKDANGYPAEVSLKEIEEWNIAKYGANGLIEYVCALWWSNPPEIIEDKNGDVFIWAHTWGWSGNESLIYALNANMLFYAVCFEGVCRGGHYVYRIPASSWIKGIEMESSAPLGAEKP